MNALLNNLLKTKNKLLACDAATYSFLGIALLSGVLLLPYSLWVVVFREGSFSRVVGAILLCVACWFGIRWTAFFCALFIASPVVCRLPPGVPH